jgi:hypothetical protein
MFQDRLSDKHEAVRAAIICAPDFCDWKTWNLDAYSTHPFRHPIAGLLEASRVWNVVPRDFMRKSRAGLRNHALGRARNRAMR